MRIAFRTDSSPRIGTGHLVRCMNLAAALRARGDDVLFISRDVSADATARIARSGSKLQALTTVPRAVAGNTLPVADLDHWLPVSEREDAAQCLALLERFAPDWLVVDHYGLGGSWESSVRRRAGRILVIDDLANREHDCDMLLDQNYLANSGERYGHWVAPQAKLLIGPRYALLASGYAERHARLRVREQVARLLVFVGGGDQSELLLKIAAGLVAPALRELEVDVVLGSMTSRRAEVETRLREGRGVRVHAHTDVMADLIEQADLCIGAGGISVWERACLGLPSVVIAVAEHQVEPALAMARSGRSTYLGAAREITAVDIVAAVERFRSAPAELSEMSRRLGELVDGCGAQRVSEEMR